MTDFPEEFGDGMAYLIMCIPAAVWALMLLG